MAGKSRDLWMSAYTPDYICSVWMGFGKEGIEKGKTTSRYKAYPGKVVQMLLKHLQSKNSKKSYPDQPSTVTHDGDDYYKKGSKHESHASLTEGTTEEPTENTDDQTSNDNQSSQNNQNGQNSDSNNTNNGNTTNGDHSGDNTGGNTGGNTGDNTEDNTGGNTGGGDQSSQNQGNNQ